MIKVLNRILVFLLFLIFMACGGEIGRGVTSTVGLGERGQMIGIIAGMIILALGWFFLKYKINKLDNEKGELEWKIQNQP